MCDLIRFDRMRYFTKRFWSQENIPTNAALIRKKRWVMSLSSTPTVSVRQEGSYPP